MSHEISADDFIELPVVYYTQGQFTAFTYPGPITYATLVQCNSSRANNPLIVISIIQPDNVAFVPDEPFVVMEISSCNSWEPECIFAANYLYDDEDNLHAFSNVTIPYNESQSTLYFRFLAVISDISISLHTEYVNDSEIFVGRYETSVFNNVGPSVNPVLFNQMAKNDQSSSVMTLSSVYYYISFCQAAIKGDYTLTATVTGQPTTPLSGFDVAICSKNVVTIQNCQVYNGGLKGIYAIQSGASVVSAWLDSADIALSEGVFVNVFGYGGELDGYNDFILSIVETTD